MTPYFGHALYVDTVGKAFDAEGNLVDPKLETRLAAYLVGFCDFVTMFASKKA